MTRDVHLGSSEAVNTHWLQPLELSAASFNPYGEVIRVGEGERIYTWSSKAAGLFDTGTEGPSAIYRAGKLASDYPVEFLVMKNRVREHRIRFLERHLHITQTIIPLGGLPFVLAVAPPSAQGADDFPSVGELRAFFVPGDCAVNLHRGTWHEVPFPIKETTTVLIASHADLTTGLMAPLDNDGNLSRGDVDKRDVTRRFGLAVRIDASRLGRS